MIVELAKGLSAEATIIIDATNKMVTPGFIDVHSHCDLVPFMSGSIRESRIRQGVTTELVGQCGLGSPATGSIHQCLTVCKYLDKYNQRFLKRAQNCKV